MWENGLIWQCFFWEFGYAVQSDCLFLFFLGPCFVLKERGFSFFFFFQEGWSCIQPGVPILNGRISSLGVLFLGDLGILCLQG